MTTLPPVPGEAMSLGPQPASASALQPTSNKPWIFFTMNSPSWSSGASPVAAATRQLEELDDSLFSVL
jgi:hypothetical protein